MKYFQILLSVIAFATIGHAIYSNRSNLPFIWKIWSRFRIMMLIESMFMLILVVIGYLGITYYFPLLNWGWMSLIYENGGNMLTTPLIGLTSGGNIGLKIVTTFALLCLIMALPFLAKIEEELFREGHLSVKNVIRQSIAFGFIHLLVGVPIAIGIMLTFTGLFYAWKYVTAFRKANEHFSVIKANEVALMEFTTYHTMYNTICMSVLLALIWLS